MLDTAQPFHVTLVENNPYDRAVIDAYFEADEHAVLRYSQAMPDGKIEPISPNDLWMLCSSPEPPHLVLVDLALTKQCEQAFGNPEYRRFLQECPAELRLIDIAFSKWADCVRPRLVDATLALVHLHANPAEMPHDLVVDTKTKDSPCAEPSLPGGQLKIIEECIQSVKAKALTPEEALSSLWGSLNVDTVVRLCEAPSLLRLFACIVSFRNTCFAVISHYADEETRLALHTVLGFRYRSLANKTREEVLEALVISKARLLARNSEGNTIFLPDHLREAYNQWSLHRSPAMVLGPFASLPLLAPQGGIVPLWRFVDEVLPNTLFASNPSLSCGLLWDETGILVRTLGGWRASGADGEGCTSWEGLLDNDVQNMLAMDLSSISVLARADIDSNRPGCCVIHEPLTDVPSVQALAIFLRTRFCGPQETRAKALFVVGGHTSLRQTLVLELKDCSQIQFHYVPEWTNSVWGRRTGCRSIFAWVRNNNPTLKETVVLDMLTALFDNTGVNQAISFSDLQGAGTRAQAIKERDRLIMKLRTIIARSADPAQILQLWIILEDSVRIMGDALLSGKTADAVLNDLGIVDFTTPFA